MTFRAKGRPEEAPITIGLKGELAAQLRQYMADHGHANPPQALREILGIYFASLPLDGAVIAARDAAMNNAKHWVFTRLSILFSEMQVEFQENIQQIEKSGYGK